MLVGLFQLQLEQAGESRSVGSSGRRRSREGPKNLEIPETDLRVFGIGAMVQCLEQRRRDGKW